MLRCQARAAGAIPAPEQQAQLARKGSGGQRRIAPLPMAGQPAGAVAATPLSSLATAPNQAPGAPARPHADTNGAAKPPRKAAPNQAAGKAAAPAAKRALALPDGAPPNQAAKRATLEPAAIVSPGGGRRAAASGAAAGSSQQGAAKVASAGPLLALPDPAPLLSCVLRADADVEQPAGAPGDSHTFIAHFATPLLWRPIFCLPGHPLMLAGVSHFLHWPSTAGGTRIWTNPACGVSVHYDVFPLRLPGRLFWLRQPPSCWRPRTTWRTARSARARSWPPPAAGAASGRTTCPRAL